MRLTRELLDAMRRDLMRRHDFAHERVGFLTCRYAELSTGDLLVLAYEYVAVDDDDYVPTDQFGALINAAAFRKALQRSFAERVGLFHVHLHPHRGIPKPSKDDVRETEKFVPDFFHVRTELPHGALILSIDALSGRIWLGEQEAPQALQRVIIVGKPLLLLGGSS
jgi:hypothetical protein